MFNADKQGLIKVEFGFVTGDGVYHETAYATDENGDFKILGMRSYFVGLREYMMCADIVLKLPRTRSRAEIIQATITDPQQILVN